MHHHLLNSIRQAHRDRIDAAAARDQGTSTGGRARGGVPSNLFDAGCWLIANGLADDERCYGEEYFSTGTAEYRRYPASAAELEAGRAAIFEGRHPIYVPLAMQVAA